MPRYQLFGNPCRTSGVARTNAAAAVVAVARTTGKNQNFRKFQEYTTGTTFEPIKIIKRVTEEVKPTMVDFNNKVLND